MNIFSGRSGWRRAAVTTGVVAAVLVGAMQAPVWAADNPAVNLSDTQWADILLGSGMRIKDSGLDLDKDTVASAELLDWRTQNPSADNRTMLIHLATVRSALNGQVTTEQAQQTHAEVLRRMLSILYGTGGSAVNGSHLTQLLAAVTGRDLAQAMQTEEQRLTGVQQDLDVDVKYDQLQSQVWADVRTQSTMDTTFATLWRQQIGTAAGAQPVSVDPTASVDTLKTTPILKDMVNVDALKAQGALGQTQFVAEVLRQETPLQNKLIDTSNQLNTKLSQATTSTPAPGTQVTPPPQSAVDQYRKQVDDWQKIIDQAKSGLDFAAQALKDVAPTAGSQLLTFVDTLYKLAGAANKLIGALETLGAATSIGAAFGGVGAVVGAAVGIVQVLGSLLSGSGSDKAAQQQILDAITSGFRAVQNSLQTIYTTMNARFDRIDSSLNQIYAKMQDQFNKLFGAIEQVNANVSQVHDQLLTLQTELESFGEAVLDGMRDMSKDPFIMEIGRSLDFPLFNNGMPLPTLARFTDAVSNYYTTGTAISRQAPFVAAVSNGDTPHGVLGKFGTSGSIDWLAGYANSHLGTNFSVPPAAGATPNMDLWAEAARAYYLTALQNPDYAVTDEGTAQVRAHSLADTGRAVNAMAAQFNTPDQNASDKVNALFKNLNTAYQNDLKTFAGKVYQQLGSQVMNPLRPFNLWYNHAGQYMNPGALTVDQLNQLPGPPPSSTQCGNGGGSIPTPSLVDGHDIGYLQYGRWIEPSWNITSCYTNARLVKTVYPSQCRTSTDCTNSYGVSVYAQFQEWVGGMPGGPYENYAYPLTRSFQTCYWGGPANTPPPSSCQTPAITPNLDQALSNGTIPWGWDHNGDNSVPAPAGDPVGKLISQRRGAYYDLVSKTIAAGGVPAANDLNNITQLYQAFAQLALPRAMTNDDQLHALVFGTHSLIADTPGGPGGVSLPILSAAYGNARDLEAQNGYNSSLPLAVLDESSTGGTPVYCSAFMDGTNDMVANCLSNVGLQRANRLYGTIAGHFQAIATGAETETQPLVDEAVDDLTMTAQFGAANAGGAPNPAVTSRSRRRS